MASIHPDGTGAPCLSATPCGPTKSGRKRPVAIPWREVACRLAEGAKPAGVAANLGLKEERIWRHLRQSLRFRFYLRQAVERQRLLAGLQLATLGQAALLSRGQKPDSLDGDLLRLLTEAAPEEEVGQQIEQLGKTGERPPNMAFRRRMAEEKRLMDLQVETWRIQDAARAAAQVAVPQPLAPTVGEPVRSATNTSEAVRSVTNTSEAPRTPTNANEHRRSETNPAEPGPPTRLSWSRPPARVAEPRRPVDVDPVLGPVSVLPARPGTVADS